MKATPFAQYLARQEGGAARAAIAPVAWPQHEAKEAETLERRRNSPLLRRLEAEKDRSEPKSGASQRLEQGRLHAFEEGRASARKELEEERARMRADFDAEIAKARAGWAAEEGEKFAAAHRAAIKSFETRCAQLVADILRPFLSRLAIGRVTDSLVENLEILFSTRNQSVFEISGPEDILDALRQRLAESGAAIAYKPNEEIDIRVCVDDTIIETQLGAWMTALGDLPRDAADE